MLSWERLQPHTGAGAGWMNDRREGMAGTMACTESGGRLVLWMTAGRVGCGRVAAVWGWPTGRAGLVLEPDDGALGHGRKGGLGRSCAASGDELTLSRRWSCMRKLRLEELPPGI